MKIFKKNAGRKRQSKKYSGLKSVAAPWSGPALADPRREMLLSLKSNLYKDDDYEPFSDQVPFQEEERNSVTCKERQNRGCPHLPQCKWRIRDESLAKFLPIFKDRVVADIGHSNGRILYAAHSVAKYLYGWEIHTGAPEKSPLNIYLSKQNNVELRWRAFQPTSAEHPDVILAAQQAWKEIINNIEVFWMSLGSWEPMAEEILSINPNAIFIISSKELSQLSPKQAKNLHSLKFSPVRATWMMYGMRYILLDLEEKIDISVLGVAYMAFKGEACWWHHPGD